jgi:hypothetical protein
MRTISQTERDATLHAGNRKIMATDERCIGFELILSQAACVDNDEPVC